MQMTNSTKISVTNYHLRSRCSAVFLYLSLYLNNVADLFHFNTKTNLYYHRILIKIKERTDTLKLSHKYLSFKIY